MKKTILSFTALLVLCLMFFNSCSSNSPSGNPLIPFKKSAADYLAEGDYAMAYQTSEDAQEKRKIFAENVLAHLSLETSDSLKNPDSFVLRKGYHYAWQNEDGSIGQYGVIYSSGTNSFGGTITSYFVWVFSAEDEKWEYWGSASTTADDDDDDTYDILVKIILNKAIDKGVEIDRSQVKHINDQFEAETLYLVELIPQDKIDTSNLPEG